MQEPVGLGAGEGQAQLYHSRKEVTQEPTERLESQELSLALGQNPFPPIQLWIS